MPSPARATTAPAPLRRRRTMASTRRVPAAPSRNVWRNQKYCGQAGGKRRLLIRKQGRGNPRQAGTRGGTRRTAGEAGGGSAWWAWRLQSQGAGAHVFLLLLCMPPCACSLRHPALAPSPLYACPAQPSQPRSKQAATHLREEQRRGALRPQLRCGCLRRRGRAGRVGRAAEALGNSAHRAAPQRGQSAHPKQAPLALPPAPTTRRRQHRPPAPTCSSVASTSGTSGAGRGRYLKQTSALRASMATNWSSLGITSCGGRPVGTKAGAVGWSDLVGAGPRAPPWPRTGAPRGRPPARANQREPSPAQPSPAQPSPAAPPAVPAGAAAGAACARARMRGRAPRRPSAPAPWPAQ